MARRLRLQFEGAMYHVINRGNYRRDVFDSVGAAQAFESTLGETCERYGWELFAYVVMRNHYHLVIGTPRPNLSEGMHWLQGTFATRFNRFRSERGHLFQGRYHTLLVENATALARVVAYIHLNPVRAKIVSAEQVANFRWSSLCQFVRGPRVKWLVAKDWLEALGFEDSSDGWSRYVQYLEALAADPVQQQKLEFGRMSQGWAIGTEGWRKAMAKEHAHRALAPGLTGEELREMKQTGWQAELATAMQEASKTSEDADNDAKSAVWKIQIAQRLRRMGASCAWIAEALHMGSAASVRAYMCRHQNQHVTP